MPTTLWLPLGAAPKHAARNEREELLTRIREAGYVLAGAELEETSYLRDVADYCEAKAREDQERQAAKVLQEQQMRHLSPEAVQQGLREYFEFRRRKLANTKRFF